MIAVDGSEAMVEQTRRRGITAFTADLAELTLDEPVDAILSTATFHWIKDHERLFARMHAALRPGGRSPRSAAARATSPTSSRRSTPSTIPRCAAGRAVELRDARRDDRSACMHAGFTDVWTWLQPWLVEPPDPKEYFTTVILGSHLERLPEEDREPFVDAVLEHGTHARTTCG